VPNKEFALDSLSSRSAAQLDRQMAAMGKPTVNIIMRTIFNNAHNVRMTENAA